MASPCVITYNGKDYTLDEFMKSVSQGEIAVGKEEENVVEKQLIDEVEGQIKQLKNDFFNEKITTSEYNKKLYPLEDKLAALKKGTPKETASKEEPTTPEPAAGATTPMPAGTQTQEVTNPVEIASNDKGSVKPFFETNIESLINTETGLASTVSKIVEKSKPYMDAYMKRKNLTMDEYQSLTEEEKRKIDQDWRNSKEYKESQEQEEVDTDKHPKYNEALKVVQSTGHASVPLIQRRLNTTYTQAQEIFRQLERDGHVLKSDENSNVYDVVTPEVVEEKQPSSDALKDVESTAKALEEVDIKYLKSGRKPTGDGKFVRYNPDDVLPLLKDFNPTNIEDVEDYVNKTVPSDASVEAYKLVPSDAILPSERTEKKDRDKIEKIKKGIKKGDDIPPIVLDFSPVIKSGEEYKFGIMDGHHRFIAYKELGIKEIPSAIITSREHYTFETNDVKISSLFNKNQEISEAYHKAKKDGSNPELVKAVEELIGGQQQQSSPQPVKDGTTPEQAKKRLDDDLEILKSIKDKKTAEQKFIGTIERAWLAKEQGKITKPEYTEFKKKAQQVLEGKIRAQDEAKATEAKLAVSKAMAKVKDRLVGKGHSPMALSAPIPVTPRTVADLIDLATSLANKAIDAGMEIKLAFAKAKRVVATHPTYMKLAKSGLLNEANFMAELDKAEYEVSKSLEELNPEPEAKQEGASVEQPSEISGPWKPKKTGERLKASPKMKEVIKEMTEDDMMYLSIDMDKASDYVNNVLNQFQAEDKLTELAEEILAGNSPFPEKIKNVANARLADRLRVMSENINDTFQKRTLIQKAGKLWSERMKSINISATQVALERLVAKDLPLSTEGIKEMYQSAFQNTQEMAMGKENVDAVKDAYNSVQEALQTEEGAKTLREAVMSELERVAEALAGKEWLDKFNAARKKIKKDLSDC